MNTYGLCLSVICIIGSLAILIFAYALCRVAGDCSRWEGLHDWRDEEHLN